MQMLRTKLHEETLRKQEEELGNERRNKIGTGDRSEKIRTCNRSPYRIYFKTIRSCYGRRFRPSN